MPRAHNNQNNAMKSKFLQANVARVIITKQILQSMICRTIA